MEEKVLKIIAQLYEHFNGDLVEIDRAFRGDYKSMQEQDIEYTKNIYIQHDVDPERIKKFLDDISRRVLSTSDMRWFINDLSKRMLDTETRMIQTNSYDLSAEDLIYVYLEGITLDEYLQYNSEGISYRNFQWTCECKAERFYNTGRAKGEPINERTVKMLIKNLRRTL